MRCGSSRSRRCSPGGCAGIRQVEVPGWWRRRSPTATAAPATRTCTPTSRSRTRSRPAEDGGSRSTDVSCYEATVAASETYNTALERHLRTASDCGSPRDPRPSWRATGRPVREMVGVDPRLPARVSRRARSHRPAAASSRATSSADRPATDRGRSLGTGPAGHARDPTGQARAPHPTPEQRSTWAGQADECSVAASREAMVAADLRTRPRSRARRRPLRRRDRPIGSWR